MFSEKELLDQTGRGAAGDVAEVSEAVLAKTFRDAELVAAFLAKVGGGDMMKDAYTYNMVHHQHCDNMLKRNWKDGTFEAEKTNKQYKQK